MAVKHFDIDDIGQISVYKRKGTKSARIRIVGTEVKITIPKWMPYSYAITFAKHKQHWINKHRKEKQLFESGSIIGKKHLLSIEYSTSNRFYSKILSDKIIIKVPSSQHISDEGIQNKITHVCEKALLQQSHIYIPQYIEQLADTHGFTYGNLSFKKLKGRWGSCDRNRNITINTHLIQLPDNIIQYILIHELVHTEHMNHGKAFWERVEVCLGNYREAKRLLKNYAPEVLI